MPNPVLNGSGFQIRDSPLTYVYIWIRISRDPDPQFWLLSNLRQGCGSMDPDLKLHPTFVFYKNYRSLLINIGIYFYFYFYLSRSRISKEKCSSRLFKYTKSPRVVAGAGQYLEHQKVLFHLRYCILYIFFLFVSGQNEVRQQGPALSSSSSRLQPVLQTGDD